MKDYVSIIVRRSAIERASSCCEYCLLPQAISPVTFHIDHIISEKQGGGSELDNLALFATLIKEAISLLTFQMTSLLPLYITLENTSGQGTSY